MATEHVPQDWYREGYLVSTKRALIQPEAFNAALSSDLIWWGKPLPEEYLKKSLDNSFCIGLYKLPESTASIAGQSNLEMIGLSRVVTDYVTFAYLTDVYVLPEYQGTGLGKWMMECLNEVFDSWPHLRRMMLVTGKPEVIPLYEKAFGAVEWNKSAAPTMSVMQKIGPAVKMR